MKEKTKLTQKQIIDFLRKNKKYMQKEFKISRIGLYGSYLYGTQNEESDIDILVQMPSDFDLFYELKEYLEANFDKKVDLGMEKNLRLLIKKKVEQEVVYV